MRNTLMYIFSILIAHTLKGHGMEDTVFREYDIRGIVGTELRIDTVYDVTRAIAYYFVEHNPNVKTVAVGMDGRTHSPAIKDEVCRALIDSGLDVLFIGMCTSPVVYFATHELDVQAGIMVTASHNPKEYNGLKLDLGHTSLWGSALKTIRDYYKQGLRVSTQRIGTLKEQQIIPAYIAWLAHQFPHLIGMQMSVVVDCGNGAAGTVMPALIDAMHWHNVQLLYPEVDGTYPHHEADPSSEKNMRDLRHALARSDAHIGIGLDGDCDRMGAMSKAGWLVPADHILALFARHIIIQHPGAGVVMDINASDGLVEALTACGARPYFSPSGSSIVKDMMQKQNAVLGGELSCHFFFTDRHPGYDDGIYAMLRLFEIVSAHQEPLESLLSFFPKKYSSPVIRIPCAEDKKFAIVEHAKQYLAHQPNVELITIDGVRIRTAHGWALIRASNTQSMLSLRFESDSQEGLYTLKTVMLHALHDIMDITSVCEAFQIKDWHEKSRAAYTNQWLS